MELQSAKHPSQVFRAVLQGVMTRLKPERALVLYGTDGKGSPFVRATHGVHGDSVLTTGEISLELLRQVLSTNEPVAMTDAMQNPKYANRTSAVLAGIRSVIGTPLRNQQGKSAGLLYADSRVKVAAFKDHHLDWLTELARKAEQRLWELGPNLDPPPESEWQRVREAGLANFRAGKLTEAQPDLEAAFNMAELWGLSDPRLARSLNELAELYRASNRLSDAEDLLQRAITLLEHQGAESQRDLAACLNNLGGLMFAEQRPVEAELTFHRALVLWERHEPNHPQLVPILSNLATLRLSQGDLEKAEDFSSRALALAEQVHGLSHPHSARCRTKHQEILVRLGRG